MGHEMKGKNIYDVFKSSLDFAPATALHRNHLSTLEGAIKGFRVFKATLFVGKELRKSTKIFILPYIFTICTYPMSIRYHLRIF